MRFATWNVNSIRTRIDLVASWLDTHRPDVLCLQETKCRDEDFPVEAIHRLGYETVLHGHDHWNGVAIVSRVGVEDVRRGFTGPQVAPFDEARLIAARCGGVDVYSAYVPNGRALDDPHYLYKLVWLERLRAELMLRGGSEDETLVTGDFNVAPTDEDIYDPRRWRRRTHASAPERSAISALLELGFVDLGAEDHHFTWWNYRTAAERNMGLRLDLALASTPLSATVESCVVDVAARRVERPSDHAPVLITTSSE